MNSIPGMLFCRIKHQLQIGMRYLMLWCYDRKSTVDANQKCSKLTKNREVQKASGHHNWQRNDFFFSTSQTQNIIACIELFKEYSPKHHCPKRKRKVSSLLCSLRRTANTQHLFLQQLWLHKHMYVSLMSTYCSQPLHPIIILFKN